MLLTSPLHLIVLRYFFSIFAFLCWTAFVARGFQAPLYSPTKGGWELWNSGFTAVETAPRTATLVLAKKARRDEWRMEIENERGTRRRRHFKENGEPRLLPFLANKALNKPPAFTYSSWSFLLCTLAAWIPACSARLDFFVVQKAENDPFFIPSKQHAHAQMDPLLQRWPHRALLKTRQLHMFTFFLHTRKAIVALLHKWPSFYSAISFGWSLSFLWQLTGRPRVGRNTIQA